MARVQSHAAVAFFLSVMKIPLVLSGLRKGCFDHIGLRLKFLYAHHIGILCGEPLEKTFAVRGADAIEVGGDDSSHKVSTQIL